MAFAERARALEAVHVHVIRRQLGHDRVIVDQALGIHIQLAEQRAHDQPSARDTQCLTERSLVIGQPRERLRGDDEIEALACQHSIELVEVPGYERDVNLGVGEFFARNREEHVAREIDAGPVKAGHDPAEMVDVRPCAARDVEGLAAVERKP